MLGTRILYTCQLCWSVLHGNRVFLALRFRLAARAISRNPYFDFFLYICTVSPYAYNIPVYPSVHSKAKTQFQVVWSLEIHQFRGQTCHGSWPRFWAFPYVLGIGLLIPQGSTHMYFFFVVLYQIILPKNFIYGVGCVAALSCRVTHLCEMRELQLRQHSCSSILETFCS